MSLDNFFIEAIAKRLKIPKEYVTLEFMKNYYEKHSGELKHLEGSTADYQCLKHVVSEKDKERLVEEERIFVESLR